MNIKRVRWALSAGAILILASTGVAGLSDQSDLEGTIVFSEASLDGSMQGTVPSLGMALVKSDHPSPYPYWADYEHDAGLLKGEAENGVMEFVYKREKALGNPAGDYGMLLVERAYREDEEHLGQVNLSIPYAEGMADLLVVPKSGAQVSLNTSGPGEWGIESSTKETKWVGDGNMEDDLPGDSRFRHGYEIEAGMPLIAADSPVEWRIKGDISLFVWGANLTISQEGGIEEVFPSGVWRTNHTGQDVHPPHGLTWDQHYQLLRIELTGADLTLDHRRGQSMWAAPEISTQVEGSVTYTAQRGFLESSNYAYNVRDETIRLEGTIDQEIKAREIQGSGLDAQVRGSASVSTPPTQRISEPELEPEPESKGSVEEEPQISPSQSWISGVNVRSWFLNPWMLLLATAVVLVGTGWRYRDRAPYVSSFTLSDWAQDALDEGKTKKARRLSKKALSKDQSNQAAWVAYGMTLIQEGDYEHTVRELEPATVGPQGHGVVTYCLATAAIQEGADAEAIKWLELAIDQTPALKEIASEDPIFSRLRQDPAYRRLMSDRSRDEERAYG